MSIRSRLLALTLALFAIPLVGYHYVRQMEDFLRSSMEANAVASAKALSGALYEREGWFPKALADNADVYAHPLRDAPQLDGYVQDWEQLSQRMTPMPWRSPMAPSATPTPSPKAPAYAGATHAQHLFVLVRIDNISPQPATADDPLSGDHLLLRLLDPAGRRHHYLVPAHASGPLFAYELVLDQLGQPIVRKALRIRGAQRNHNGGATIELRLPLSMVGARLGLVFSDAYANGIRIAATTATNAAPLGVVVAPSAAIERVASAVGLAAGRRIWVTDAQGRVLARLGSLGRPKAERLHPWIATLLGMSINQTFSEPGPVDRLVNDQVTKAARGASTIRWHLSAAGEELIISAAAPIHSHDQVVGTVFIEESATPIHAARGDALVYLLVVTVAVLVLAAAGLGWLATSISRRLRQLRTAAQDATDVHGRVVGTMGDIRGRDEIAGVARAFDELLQRLGEYNRYLERLAARLSHELRTPLAVIRSSLDNLEMDTRAQARTEYLQRARAGIQRLQLILTRMSEARRLEEAIDSIEDESLDLVKLVSATVRGYHDAWPDTPITLVCQMDHARVHASLDLLVQMLDKLVANAVSFSAPGLPVELELLTAEDAHARAGFLITVTNYDATLPAEVGNRLFESMVSSRPRAQNAASEPHLGLGLYIVRLVVEHHRGSVLALQLQEPQAVRFEVWLPASSEQAKA
jgi:two-component system, OmpR family, sensor histidine kinase ChvG